jgi:hypothetical protein
MDQWNSNRSLQPDPADFEQDDADRRGKRRRELDAKCKERLDDALDEALEESFPASDPVSVTQPFAGAYDRHRR